VVKVADFGLSRRFDPSLNKGFYCATSECQIPLTHTAAECLGTDGRLMVGVMDMRGRR